MSIKHSNLPRANFCFSIHRTFRIYDDDSSRSLSLAEFGKGIHDYGITMSDEEVSALFDSFDKNSDGNLSFDEFLVALRVSDKRWVYQSFRH